MLDDFDTWLSVIDIILCIVDISLIIYLFFIRLPQERQKPFRSRIRKLSSQRKRRC